MMLNTWADMLIPPAAGLCHAGHAANPLSGQGFRLRGQSRLVSTVGSTFVPSDRAVCDDETHDGRDPAHR